MPLLGHLRVSKGLCTHSEHSLETVLLCLCA